MNFAIKILSFAVPCMTAAIGLVTPANASLAPDRSENASELSTVQSSDASAPAAATKHASTKICIAMPALTGSRMPSRKCRTKAEWETSIRTGVNLANSLRE